MPKSQSLADKEATTGLGLWGLDGMKLKRVAKGSKFNQE